jgi:tRNA pseudouridine38-40 synthase
MRNILLTLSYDGTDFCGWQKQEQAGKTLRTVQGEVENALTRLHAVPTVIHGSGRTDSGVHARAQGANFLSPVPGIPVSHYMSALNDLLPPDVRVHRALLVPQDFHARFSAVMRTYRYVLHCGPVPTAALAGHGWHLRYDPNPAALNRMASCLSGEIDCTTFAAAGDKSLSRYRFLEKAVFFPQGNRLVFEISANAFLWKMVRSLVGTLIDYEHGGKSPDDFRAALESRDRSRAGQTAPAKGLFLWNIEYKGTENYCSNEP